MRKFLKTIVIISLIFFFSLLIIYAPSIFQEGNPLPVVYGILKLSITKDEYVKIDDHKYITTTKGDAVNNLKEYLARNNLTHTEQLGAAHFFKNNKQYIAETRMYSKNFMIWDFSNPINQGLILP